MTKSSSRAPGAADPLVVGASVEVTSLRKTGRIVEQRGGRYRVAVGSLLVWAESADLRAVTAKVEKKQIRGDARTGPMKTDPGGSRVIDLHGLTAEQAREAVVAAIDRAIVDGLASVELVHGKGRGVVKEVVAEVLATLPVVRHVRVHPTNPGVTIAHL